LRIGASSWSAPSWEGVFYPQGTPPGKFIEYYARRFDTVEIDATFYRTPDARTVDGWRDKTPPGFLFAAKVPQIITHEKLLENCRDEMIEFVRVMERLGDRLGPMLLQFRYFRKAELPDPGPFLDRLERFLPMLPSGFRFAVEVRNRGLLTERFFGMLRRHGVALAFIDHPWFARVEEFFAQADRAIGPAGRVVAFDSNLWHAAGVNRSPARRRGLTIAFTRPFMKQQLDYPRALGYAAAGAMSPALRQVLGYNARVPASLEEWYQPAERRMYQRDQG
jgi:hypothetical protein